MVLAKQEVPFSLYLKNKGKFKIWTCDKNNGQALPEPDKQLIRTPLIIM